MVKRDVEKVPLPTTVHVDINELDSTDHVYQLLYISSLGKSLLEAANDFVRIYLFADVINEGGGKVFSSLYNPLTLYMTAYNIHTYILYDCAESLAYHGRS